MYDLPAGDLWWWLRLGCCFGFAVFVCLLWYLFVVSVWVFAAGVLDYLVAFGLRLSWVLLVLG